MNIEEFIKLIEMDKEEFIKYIESIGFKLNYGLYEFKEFIIELYDDLTYDFYDGSDWIYLVTCANLKPFENYFKKELRSIKLKKILK